MNFPKVRRALISWSWEIICFLVYVLLAGSQLFMRPIVGMADNGDFPKVLGPRSLCDTNDERDVFAYVNSRYIISYPCHWDPELPSTESLFVRLVKLIAKWRGNNGFGIRAVGKAHLSMVLAAWIILLWALHGASPPLRFGLPPLVILIFSDVAYVAYLNSFYMDAASLVFLLPTVALAAAWVLRPRLWVPIAFGVAGVLLALSKTQHAITGFLLAVVAAWLAWREFRSSDQKPVPERDGRGRGWLWTASAATVAMAAALIIFLTPKGYKAEPLYSLIFSRMADDLPDRAGTLAQLGLPASDLKYFGTHAYSSGAAIADTQWRVNFVDRVSYTRLAIYYARNPRLTWRLIERAISEDVAGIRPGNLGNYSREDGFPPGTLAQRFDFWSNLRSWLLRVLPIHMALFYGLMVAASGICLFRRNWAERWPAYPLVVVLTIAGMIEFLFPVLLDGTETARHLFFFHVITEILIICMAAGVLSLLRRGAHNSDSFGA